MNASDLIQHIRLANNDDDSAMWADEQYAKVIDEGRRFIFENYPESRLDSSGALVAYSDTDLNNLAATMTFPPDLYFVAIMDYALYRYYSAEGGDPRDNSRAADYLRRFQGFFTPGG